MKPIYLILFSLCFSVMAEAQNLQYFTTDTISPRIVYLKLKSEGDWSKPMLGEWHWRNDSEMIKNMEKDIFKTAFHGIDWKQIPALLKVGVFFRFDKTLHIDYVHFVIYTHSFPREDLVPLEKNFLDYTRLLKKVDLSPYLYIDNPSKFECGIGRFGLIHEKSPVWNEK